MRAEVLCYPLHTDSSVTVQAFAEPLKFAGSL